MFDQTKLLFLILIICLCKCWEFSEESPVQTPEALHELEQQAKQLDDSLEQKDEISPQFIYPIPSHFRFINMDHLLPGVADATRYYGYFYDFLQQYNIFLSKISNPLTTVYVTPGQLSISTGVSSAMRIAKQYQPRRLVVYLSNTFNAGTLELDLKFPRNPYSFDLYVDVPNNHLTDVKFLNGNGQPSQLVSFTLQLNLRYNSKLRCQNKPFSQFKSLAHIQTLTKIKLDIRQNRNVCNWSQINYAKNDLINYYSRYPKIQQVEILWR